MNPERRQMLKAPIKGNIVSNSPNLVAAVLRLRMCLAWRPHCSAGTRHRRAPRQRRTHLKLGHCPGRRLSNSCLV